jgi:hypothetical protein
LAVWQSQQPDRNPGGAANALRDACEGRRQGHGDDGHALINSARKLSQEPYKSLTWDRGKEMAGHKRFTLATDTKVDFCVDRLNPQAVCGRWMRRIAAWRCRDDRIRPAPV